MAFGIDDAITAVATLADSVVKAAFPDPQDKAKADAIRSSALVQAAIAETNAGLQAIVEEAKSGDRWTSRARPSFLYVIYLMLLASIPMGVLWAFAPVAAEGIATGLQKWLAAIPDAMWQLFSIGYLGYTGGRSWEKVKGVSK
jgi:hypothetical protein